VVVVREEDVSRAREHLAAEDEDAFRIGRVAAETEDTDGSHEPSGA
jgi:phosphoribosylaminoimidazole (AIR) synthetase